MEGLSKILEEERAKQAPDVEEEIEETENPTPTEEETEAPEEEKEAEVKDVEGETPRERALRQELARVKKQNREARRLSPLEAKATEEEEEEQATVTRSEAIVYNSFQDNALAEFLESHPAYAENDEAWGAFMAEFEDRVPLVEWARRKKQPLTEKLIKERLESIHRSLGSDAQTAKEEGKRELLKAQSAAAVMSAGSSTGGKAPEPTNKPKPLFTKRDNSLSSWITKKK